MRRKPSRLPPNAKRERFKNPGAEIQKACNKLYYGDENISEPPGKVSMFRAVVVAGAVLTVPEPGGDPVITCGGNWTIDPQEPEYTRALADYLRVMADGLEKEVAS